MGLPPELCLPKHYVAKQARCVYGTSGTGMIREQCYRNALEAMGFTSGISKPYLLHHAERDITVGVHGDDFTAMATLELEKTFEVKVCGRLGQGTVDQEIRILNRAPIIRP